MKFKKLSISYNLLFILFIIIIYPCFGKINQNHEISEIGKLSKTAGTPVRTLLNINLISHWIYANGISAHNYYTDGNGVYYPRGTYGAGLVYNDGFVWGGMVKDGQQPELRVGGVTFNTGLMQGSILSKGIAEDPDEPDVRIWRIRSDYKEADLTQDAAEMEEKSLNAVSDRNITDLRNQYKKDWDEWPWYKGAPFYDTNGNSIMDQWEKPGLAGADQVVWFAANDLDESRTQSLYGSPPVGIEVQVTMWGYNRNDALGNVIFKRYRIIYKGTKYTSSDAVIDSLFFAVWADPDIGDHTDDFVGCDTTLNMMFGYNSVPGDAKFSSYNLAPPAVSYDFFQGPMIYTGNPEDVAIFDMKKRSGYKNLGMKYFNYFAAGSSISDPSLYNYLGTEQWYNLMNGLLPRAKTKFTDVNGNPSDTPLQDDPASAATGSDVDGLLYPAGDRRMEMITGPISMALGDTQEVVVALVCGIGDNHLSSVSAMKYNDISAQYAYDNGFDIAKAPKNPKLAVTNFDGKILLNWGWDVEGVVTTESEQNGYVFEGYNVYQLPSAYSTLADASKLATFDVVNGIKVIWDDRIDEASGQVVNKPVQVGKDSGIQRTFTITRDAFTWKPMINGTDYYFAVTAYNYNSASNALFRSLESSLDIKVARPHSIDPGIQYGYEIGDSVNTVHQGDSDGTVEVSILDPTKTTGHTYNVVFDSLSENIVWFLLDLTSNDTLLKNMTDQSIEQMNPFVDGFSIKVLKPSIAGINPDRIGVAFGQGSDASERYLKGWDFFGKPWVSGYDIGGEALYGGLVNGIDFLGSTIETTDYVDVELRFTDDPDTANLNEWQNSVVYRKNIGEPYPSAGVGKVPFQAWDVWGNRQLNVCFIEMDSVKTPSGNPVPANSIWDMAWDGTEFGIEGGHEIIFIMNSTYVNDPTTIYNDLNYGPSADILYVLWPYGKDDRSYLESKFTISIFASRGNAVIDVFSFKTEAPTYDSGKAKSDVDDINVYPNPYYGSNPRERTTIDRFVSFNHLPQKATIRIFDLSAVHVRTLEKDDPSQFFRWDLRNHNGLPVASGLYIIHIEMPELNEVKILKLSIVREQEFLEIY